MFDSLKTSTEAVGLLCILVILLLVVIMLLFGTVIEWFKKRKLRRGEWAALSGGESQKEELDVDDDTMKDEWQMTEPGARRSVCTIVRQPLSSASQLPDGHFLAQASSWMCHTGSQKEETVPVDLSKAVMSGHHQSPNTLASTPPATKPQSSPWTPINNTKPVSSWPQPTAQLSPPVPPKNITSAARFADFETHDLVTSASVKPSAVPITKLLPLPPHTPPRTPIRNIFSSPLRSPDTPAFRITPPTNTSSLSLHTMRKFRPLPPLPVFRTKDDCGGPTRLQEEESTKDGEGWMKVVGVTRSIDRPMKLQAHGDSHIPVSSQKQDVTPGKGLPFGRPLPQAKVEGLPPWTPQNKSSSSPMSSPPTLVFDPSTRYTQSSTPFTRQQYLQTPFTPCTPYTPHTSNTAQTPNPPSFPASQTYTAPTLQTHPQDLYFLPLTSPTSSAWNSPTRPIFFEPTMTPPSAFAPPLTQIQKQKRLSKQDLYMKPVPPIPSVTRADSKYEDVTGSGFSPLPLRSSNHTTVPMLLRLPTLAAFPATTNIPRKPLPITKKSASVIPTLTTMQPLAHHDAAAKHEEWKRCSEITFLEEDWSDLEITPEEEEEEDVELGLGKKGRMVGHPIVPRSAAWK